MRSEYIKINRSKLANLIMHISGKAYSWCLTNSNTELSLPEYALLSRWLKLLQQGVPLAYILGFREFFSRNFWVNSYVLIPRQESELLVEIAINSVTTWESCKFKKKIKILELGTGSGAVIISLVLELIKRGIHVNAHATDLSKNALSVAKNNALWLGADISFSRGNWFDAFKLSKQTFDLIIVNPPYVGLNHSEYLSKRELSFEPKLALYGLNPSSDGMGDFKKIINGLKENTQTGSVLIMEHGCMQKKQIRILLQSSGLSNFEEFNDYSGLPRLVKVRL